MRWLDHRDPVPAALRGAVIALGNFDGFHLGHQAVAGEAIAWAKAEGRPSIIATFDPHPVRHFAPHTPPFRLTTLDQRQELFGAAGADAMLVIHFGADVAGMTALEWI
ncbi:MAG: adenylyltransferase/cytidyltransferase family protein, partial [Novosphingobium meiothermophilum]